MASKPRKKKIQLLAMDFGSRSIKFAVGQETSGKLKLSHTFMVRTGEGVYDNGNILDAQALKAAVQAALKANHVSVSTVAVTIESTEMIKREMIIPKVDDDDRSDLVSFEVNQYLPIDISAYVIQYVDLGDVKDGDVVKSKVLLGAVPKDMVKSILDFVKSCGLAPEYLDMHSNSIEKLVQASISSNLYTQPSTIAMIDFGNKMIDIGIYEKGQYKFNRLLKMGGEGMDKVLSEHLNISVEEAEERKQKTSIMALTKAISEENVAKEEDETKVLVIKESLSYVNECLDEINKVFKYYTSRSAENHIDKVLLYGGGSALKDFNTYAQSRLDLPVETLKLFNFIDAGAKIKSEELPLYASAIGALIRK